MGTDNNSPLRPGSITPNSGQYVEVGPRGGYTGGHEITGVQGHRLPPTSRPGNGFVLTDRTNNGAGRGK
jgi:hypothetical protein